MQITTTFMLIQIQWYKFIKANHFCFNRTRWLSNSFFKVNKMHVLSQWTWPYNNRAKETSEKDRLNQSIKKTAFFSIALNNANNFAVKMLCYMNINRLRNQHFSEWFNTTTPTTMMMTKEKKEKENWHIHLFNTRIEWLKHCEKLFNYFHLQKKEWRCGIGAVFVFRWEK